MFNQKSEELSNLGTFCQVGSNIFCTKVVYQKVDLDWPKHQELNGNSSLQYHDMTKIGNVKPF